MAKNLSKSHSNFPILIMGSFLLLIILVVVIYATGQRTSTQPRAAKTCLQKCEDACIGKSNEDRCKKLCQGTCKQDTVTPREKCRKSCEGPNVTSCLTCCDRRYPPTPMPAR